MLAPDATERKRTVEPDACDSRLNWLVVGGGRYGMTTAPQATIAKQALTPAPVSDT